ncbi:MAG: flagellar basal body rod protein FlgC [Syntrophaceae bacterium]|nr:flagellar basal body rod protein FlgC [Syntrophaceae bacterium]
MDFMTAYKISSAGLSVQRTRMDIISANLANISTTRTAEGGPYKKKHVTVAEEDVEGPFFDELMRNALKSVKVDTITEDVNAVKYVYEPGHPDADPDGYVAMPDINHMMEMAHMLGANRAYQAGVTALDATKNITMKALEIGK